MGQEPAPGLNGPSETLTVNYDGSDPQLYDLETDASETTNLAATHPDIVDRLRVALFEWNATLPADAGDPAYRP